MSIDPATLLVGEVTGEAPRGPYQMAQDCRAMALRLDAEIAAAKTKREARGLRQRRRLCREIEQWCRTRAGYVEPGQ